MRSRIAGRSVGMVLVVAGSIGLSAATSADESEKPAIPPRIVKLDQPHAKLDEVIGLMNRRSGIPVTYPPAAAKEECDVPFPNGAPFWVVLEAAADRTGNRIALHDSGRKVALVPRGRSREVSSIHGAFRVVAERVVARYLLEDGVTTYEVQFNVHWEPRFPVFRIDSEPTVTRARDDRGTDLTAAGGKGRANPGGAATHPATVRLNGLTRESKKVALMAGSFTVTASDKMLSFRFPDLTAKAPVTLPPQGNVAAVLRRFEKDENTWEAEVELTYPPTIPEFESFETWTTENRLRLVSPDGSKSYPPDSHAINAVGRKVTATYYFKEDPQKGLVNPASKGWSLAYDAPSTPIEFRVPFELKDIPLP